MQTPLPPLLEAKLADFRRRVWIVKLTEGLLAALFGLALSWLLVFVLDRFWETPAIVRGALLAAGAAVLGLGLPLKWHRWVWRQRRLEDAARLLRRTFPRLGDRLLGIVELAHADTASGGRSERLVRAAIEQAAEEVKHRDFTHAVPEARHRQWGWIAGSACALIVTAFVLVSDAARNTLLRWIAPWRPVERYTFARSERLPDRLVVPYAEPFALPVKLAPETRWSPREGTGRISGQPAVTVPLKEGEYPLAFPPQKTDAPMAVSVGDLRHTVKVEPRTRPELSGLAVHLKLPDYLQYTTQPVQDVHGGALAILKGAQASFELKAGRDLAAATLDGAAQPVTGSTVLTTWEPVQEDAERTLRWTDRDGLTPREPLTLKIHAAADEAPSIVARRETVDQVVLDSEVITLEVAANDDYGVRRVGLDWVGSEKDEDGKTPFHGDKVTAGGAPEQKQLTTKATFCAERDGVPPQTLELRAWAEDYLPGRKRSHSAVFTLQILNKTDHALWLTEQFGKWLEAAKESYEHEQQLHQTNQDLRALSAEDLDRPENRRRVRDQAAAENGQAARVDNLTASGRNLVEQATKNDEFDAKRLETWATMLQTLRDIGARRMPSVTDLLKQTASAAAGTGKQGQAQASSGQNAGAKPPGSNAQQSSGQNAQNPAGQNNQTAQNSPNSQQNGAPQPNPKEGQPGAQSESKSAPTIAKGEQPPPGGKAPAKTEGPAKPSGPSISMRESGFLKPEDKPADPNAKPSPPKPSRLTLPNLTMGAAPGGDKKKDEEKEDGAPTPAQQKMDKAITEQKDLLAEFAKVSDQLSEILGSMEASTFVKRFKAASREQISIASTISQKTLDAFGIERASVKAAPPIARKAKDQSEVVRVIQSDLDAYFQRKQDARYRTVLDQMRKTEIVQALARGGEKVTVNLSGQSMNSSEYWADTLDRWAEELVAASECKECKSNGSADSLPPEVVLKVMQALREEMALRDETREAETARPAVPPEKYAETAESLGKRQTRTANRVQSAVDDIAALPDGDKKFQKEMKLLAQVMEVMDEAHGILVKPDTGAPAVAAETEAIELLLQAKRQGKKPGGGGGSNPGQGGSADSATLAALSDLGPGADAKATVVARSVGQATGRAGREFPEEFRSGLETYFNLLEAQPANP